MFCELDESKLLKIHFLFCLISFIHKMSNLNSQDHHNNTKGFCLTFDTPYCNISLKIFIHLTCFPNSTKAQSFRQIFLWTEVLWKLSSKVQVILPSSNKVAWFHLKMLVPNLYQGFVLKWISDGHDSPLWNIVCKCECLCKLSIGILNRKVFVFCSRSIWMIYLMLTGLVNLMTLEDRLCDF